MIRRLAILGASGDLTARYLLPAIARLHAAGVLPEGFAVLGIARDDWETTAFRRHIAARLAHHAGDVPPTVRAAATAMLTYHRADVTAADQLAGALGGAREPLVVYLALPPRILGPVVEALTTLRLPAGSRVVVEKPFGEDLASAQALNRQLHAAFLERAIFRVDHFLALQSVQNILGLRFAIRRRMT